MNPAVYERMIIKLLFKDTELREKIFPFLKVEIFDTDFSNQNIVKNVLAFSEKYDKFPNEIEIKTFIKDTETIKAFNDCLNLA